MTEAKCRIYKYPRASMQSLRDESKMFDSLPGEEWILEAQARLSVKLAGFPAGGAPGFVSVSNLRVVFEPAKTSVTGATADIRMENIERVRRTRNMLVFPNSLKIFTKDGTSHKLTTWSRNAIVDLVSVNAAVRREQMNEDKKNPQESNKVIANFGTFNFAGKGPGTYCGGVVKLRANPRRIC